MSDTGHVSSYSLPFPGGRPESLAGRAVPHPWVRPASVALDPETADPLLAPLLRPLQEGFLGLGSKVTRKPNRGTSLIITTARLGEVISTREALFLRAKAIFKLARHPTVFTLVSTPRAEMEASLALLDQLRDATDEDLERFSFPDMPTTGLVVLREETRRVGPIRALSRLVQVQVKCLRVGAVVGDPASGQVDGVYLFDLAGGYPFVTAPRTELLAADLAARLVTVTSATEADHHEQVRTPISQDDWERSPAAEAMIGAARELGGRGFLAPPVELKDFGFRALGRLIAAQYSEGSFATYDPKLGVMLATGTGSARLIDKRSITRDDIALIMGIRPDGTGARVVRVQDRPLVTPSVEAVELARIVFGAPRFAALNGAVPISIIHLHMGIAAYNPARVEYAELAPSFYAFPVSCGTRQLAEGTAEAFARSSVLGRTEERRRLVVLEQPAHGCLMVEVGGDGEGPRFQRIFDALDRGDIVLGHHVPQGPVHWQPPDGNGMVHKAPSGPLV